MLEAFLIEHKIKIKKLYNKEKYNFPIIGSVLDGLQSGKVFTNNLENPKCAFVLHTFGWSQIFGEADNKFIENLKQYIFKLEKFQSIKIRNYTPSFSEIFENSNSQLAERCKFKVKGLKTKNLKVGANYEIKKINNLNCKKINDHLNIDLFTRFWPSEISFNNNSFGFLVECKGEVVSVCYSCGIYNNIHEIDVFTKVPHRGKGIAKIVCTNFINYCFQNKLKPNWDCFINNVGSIELSKSLGYEKILEPYKFYTYNRNS
jgi:hypothetical protein